MRGILQGGVSLPCFFPPQIGTHSRLQAQANHSPRANKLRHRHTGFFSSLGKVQEEEGGDSPPLPTVPFPSYSVFGDSIFDDGFYVRRFGPTMKI